MSNFRFQVWFWLFLGCSNFRPLGGFKVGKVGMFFDMACPWICVFLPVGWVFGLQELLLSLVVVSPYFVHLRATATNSYRSLLITVSFVDTNMVPLMKLEWFEGMTTKKSPAFYQFSHLHWLPFQLSTAFTPHHHTKNASQLGTCRAT